MPTQTITYTFSGAGGSLPSDKVSITAPALDGIDIDIPANQTNLHKIFALPVSALKLLYIVCDQNVTIKTNSSGSPADTINLLAGVPLVWQYGVYHANPFASNTDVTSVYLTNVAAGTLSIRYMFNP